MKLKKAMIIRKIRAIVRVGVAFAGPKGRRSNVVKPIAGDIACGTAPKLAREREEFYISDAVQLAPNWDVTAISNWVNCGTTYVGMVFWSRADK